MNLKGSHSVNFIRGMPASHASAPKDAGEAQSISVISGRAASRGKMAERYFLYPPLEPPPVIFKTAIRINLAIIPHIKRKKK